MPRIQGTGSGLSAGSVGGDWGDGGSECIDFMASNQWLTGHPRINSTHFHREVGVVAASHLYTDLGGCDVHGGALSENSQRSHEILSQKQTSS